MININIFLDNNKLLYKVIAEGHSQFSIKGNDIVCSAVSCLLYSGYLALDSIPGIKLVFEDKENIMIFDKIEYTNDVIGELRGVTLFLIKGLKAIENSYDKNIKLVINK